MTILVGNWIQFFPIIYRWPGPEIKGKGLIIGGKFDKANCSPIPDEGTGYPDCGMTVILILPKDFNAVKKFPGQLVLQQDLSSSPEQSWITLCLNFQFLIFNNQIPSTWAFSLGPLVCRRTHSLVGLHPGGARFLMGTGTFFGWPGDFLWPFFIRASNKVCPGWKSRKG